MNDKPGDYLSLCRKLYFSRITPLSAARSASEDFNNLRLIAEKYFAKGNFQDFADFFQEGQYFIQLWTAHFFLSNQDTPEIFIKESVKQIRKYSESPLNPEVAKEEEYWLRENIFLFEP